MLITFNDLASCYPVLVIDYSYFCKSFSAVIYYTCNRD